VTDSNATGSEVPSCDVYIFVDAFGWEVFERYPWFLEGVVDTRERARTVLGYSSTCIPSIITGSLPDQHGHFSSFFYSPDTSPFRRLKWLGLLPDGLVNRGRVRAWISKAIARLSGYTGYFQIYDTPFKYLPLFDYQEKHDIFAAERLNGQETVFERWRKQGVAHELLVHTGTDRFKLEQLQRCIREGVAEKVYVHLVELDNLLHHVPVDDLAVEELLRSYDSEIRAALDDTNGCRIGISIFSDHGMREVERTVDVLNAVQSTGAVFGRDYVAYFDSTMARFWFPRDKFKASILSAVSDLPNISLLDDDYLREEGARFEKNKYGEEIFLTTPGSVIHPGFMGEAPLFGMHGYDPKDSHSWAVYLSNRSDSRSTRSIMDVFPEFAGDRTGA